MVILMYVKMFANKMLFLTQKKRFRELTRNQFSIINDQALDYGYYQYKMMLDSDKPGLFQRSVHKLWQYYIYGRISKLLFCKSFFYRLLIFFNQKRFVIYPDSLFKISWDFFILILLILNILYIPLKISFQDHLDFNISDSLSVVLDTAPSWTFLVDILLNFNTAQYKKGVLVTDRVQIAKNYFKGHFFWDFVIIIPFFFSSRFNIQ